MSDIKRYLVEEVVVDHGDGLISRREALHRLSLLGLGAATAGTMLAGCAGDKPGAAMPDATPSATAPSATPSATSSAAPASTAPPGAATALATEAITFAGPEGRRLQGAWAAAGKPRGAVLVIHENRGLTDHIRSLAGRSRAATAEAVTGAVTGAAMEACDARRALWTHLQGHAILPDRFTFLRRLQ